MPGTNDEMLRLIVSMKDEASAGMKKLQGNLDQVAREMKATNKASEDLGRTSQKFSAGFSDVAASSRRFAIGMAGAATAAAGLVGYGVKIAGDLEAARQGFVTLLGSASEADRVMANIKKEAARTPFEIPGLTTATQMLASVTHNGDKALKVVLDIGEGLSAMGKGQAELDRVAVNLQQIAALGKASAIDIKQFAYAGLPIYDMLREKVGLAGAALSKFTEEGGVTFDLLAEMFDKANDKGGKFFDAFKNQAGTFNQLFSNMKDSVNIFASDFVKQTGLFDAVKNALQQFTDVLTKHREEIIEYGTKAVRMLSDNVYILAAALTGALLPAFVSLVSIGGGYVAVLAALGASLGYVASQAKATGDAVQRTVEANDQARRASDDMIAGGYREIAMLEAKRKAAGQGASDYITFRQAEIQANNRYLAEQKKVFDLEAQYQKATHVAWNEFRKASDENDARLVKQKLDRAKAAMDQEKAEVDRMASFRKVEMDARIRLGEQEYQARVRMLDALKVTEKSVREEILGHAGIMSQKEVKLMADKLNAELRLANLFRKGIQDIFNTPVIQQVRVAFASGDSPLQKAVSGFKALGKIDLGSAVGQIGGAIGNFGKEALGAFGGVMKLAEQTDGLAKSMNAVTGAVTGAGGGGKGGGGGSAKNALEEAKKKSEEAAKEMAKMREEVDKGRVSYGEFAKKVKESLTALEEEHRSKVKSINDQITGLTGNLMELQKAFGMNMQGTRNDIADAYVKQVALVDDLRKQQSTLEKQEMTEENRVALVALREKLSVEEKALSDHKDVATVYAAEIAENKRREQIGEFARFMEDIAAKRTALQEEYNAKRDLLTQEIKDLTDQRAQEQAIYEEKKAELGKVADAARRFGTIWSNVMKDLTAVTQEKVGSMNAMLDSLKGKLEAVLSLQRQTGTGGGPNLNLGLPARASGGGVSAGEGYVVGENGPEWFEPGRSGFVTPNGRLGGGGNVSITINNPSVRGDDDLRAMERIVDKAVRQVFINNKI